MPIYELAPDRIQPLTKTTFGAMQMHERRDLQRLLREHIGVIAPETLVIAEEYGEWDDSRRRVDLLGVDRDANLVVIELKRTEDGGQRLIPLMPGSPHFVGRCLREAAGLSLLLHVSERMQAGERRSGGAPLLS